MFVKFLIFNVQRNKSRKSLSWQNFKKTYSTKICKYGTDKGFIVGGCLYSYLQRVNERKYFQSATKTVRNRRSAICPLSLSLPLLQSINRTLSILVWPTVGRTVAKDGRWRIWYIKVYWQVSGRQRLLRWVLFCMCTPSKPAGYRTALYPVRRYVGRPIVGVYRCPRSL